MMGVYLIIYGDGWGGGDGGTAGDALFLGVSWRDDA